MKLKSIFIYIAVSIVFLSTNSCMSTVKFEELKSLPDRTFYLDKFETGTLGMMFGFDLTEADTKKLQNHYAKNIPIGKIKSLFEKRLNIKIDTTEFEAAVKQGPITENINSVSEETSFQWFARWKATNADKHKNQIIISFTAMTEKYYGHSGECPLYIYYFYLVVDGKFIEIEYDRHTDLGFIGRYPNCNLSKDKWVDYYASCINDIYNSIEKKVLSMKK